MPTYRTKNILIPISFSRASMVGLGVAMGVARRAGIRVLLLHVLEPRWDEPESAMASFRDNRSLPACERLNFLCDSLSGCGISATPILRRGIPGEEIVKAAEQEQADLIVVSLHNAGRSGGGSAGRTAQFVLEKAPCEVWCVRGRPSVWEQVKASVGKPIPARVAG